MEVIYLHKHKSTVVSQPLGSNFERSAGSIPVGRTNRTRFPLRKVQGKFCII